MRHLNDTKKVIKGHLCRFLTKDKDTITSKIKEVKYLVLKELSNSDRDEKEICKQIEKCAESEKNKIDNHVKDLTENLHNANAAYTQRVQAIAENVTNTELRR